MSDRHVLIVHGWSDKSESFQPLAKFLENNGFKPVLLWLGDYISMDDDVKVEDVAKRMHILIDEKLRSGELKKPFDMIVHSTGGLVAREWITACYLDNVASCPLKRLVMLAPANYGSKLASMGQSLLGRIFGGWGNWFHTGKEMLASLELSSPYLWRLVQKDMLVPEGKIDNRKVYTEQGVWPFVITGTHPYPDTIRKIINENGSDGTVRVPAANLNTRGVTIDFAANETNPQLRPWDSRCDFTIPLAVLPDRSHTSIKNPQWSDVDNVSNETRKILGKLILEALNCEDFDKYKTISNTWSSISEDTASLINENKRNDLFGGQEKNPEIFHQYMQVNVYVVDDHGADVADYFIEFSEPDGNGNNDPTIYFHSEVLEHVHKNSENPSYRCLFIDRTDLLNEFYKTIAAITAKVLTMSISATPPGNNIHYFLDSAKGAAGVIPVHREVDSKEQRWLQRNTTHFVKIIIPRVPKQKVFELKRA